MLQGLVYHAHHRPLTAPVAALLDLSATLHRKTPQSIPTPSSVIRRLASSSLLGGGRGSISPSLASIADAFVIPPIHVDQVAEAICTTLDSRNGIKGVVADGLARRKIEVALWFSCIVVLRLIASSSLNSAIMLHQTEWMHEFSVHTGPPNLYRPLAVAIPAIGRII
jgi:hypothetical protein